MMQGRSEFSSGAGGSDRIYVLETQTDDKNYDTLIISGCVRKSSVNDTEIV